jgi:lipoate-protein ligase A
MEKPAGSSEMPPVADGLDIGRYPYDDPLLEATRLDGRPRVSVYRLPDPVIVLGRGSDPAVELQIDACLRDGIPVLRRRGGGCAVVLDSESILVSASLPAPGIGAIRAILARLSDWLVSGLERAGIGGNIRREGVSDIAVGDRKVGGACLYRPKDLALYSASLLTRPRIEWMERYLRTPPREPSYRRRRGHRAFVGALADLPGFQGAPLLARRLQNLLEPPTFPEE